MQFCSSGNYAGMCYTCAHAVPTGRSIVVVYSVWDRAARVRFSAPRPIIQKSMFYMDFCIYKCGTKRDICLQHSSYNGNNSNRVGETLFLKRLVRLSKSAISKKKVNHAPCVFLYFGRYAKVLQHANRVPALCCRYCSLR